MSFLQVSAMINLVVMLGLEFGGSGTAYADYCAICPGGDHTMCKFKGNSPECKNYANAYTDLSSEQILNAHNELRNKLVNGSSLNPRLPKAANMRLMIWDPELATIAHRWISQCIQGHDQCRDTPTDKVGQNVGLLMRWNIEDDSDLFVKMVYQNWDLEIQMISEQDVDSFRMINGIDNSSQLYWAKSYKLGCSQVTYTGSSGKVKAIACNYAPKGNIIGEPIYMAGEPCSACPEDTRCGVDESFQLLCGREEDMNTPNDFILRNPGEIISGSGHDTATTLVPIICILYGHLFSAVLN